MIMKLEPEEIKDENKMMKRGPHYNSIFNCSDEPNKNDYQYQIDRGT